MPIKRHEKLKPLSREHHQSLLLCWKIREGLKRNVAPERIKLYVNWFWDTHLKEHFELEEKFLFPILGNENKLIKKAISEHRRLKRLFNEKVEIQKSLSLIEEELESHVRFEERILFNEIQEAATAEQLEALITIHKEPNLEDNLTDVFWQ